MPVGFRPPSAGEKSLPANYQLVLAIVTELEPGLHRSAHDIYVAARSKQPSLGFSTVYRALIRLRDRGLISEILIPGAAAAVYEPAAAEHAHFYCVQCGNVRDLDYHVPQAVVEQLARAQDAEVNTVSVALHGLCSRCRAS